MTDDLQDKFIKIMMMTTSSHDAEALSALRMAQDMLAKSNMNWEEYINKKGLRLNSPQQKRDTKNNMAAQEINEMIALLKKRVSPYDSFYEFVLSIEDWWLKRRFLTKRQLEALRNAATRHGYVT